MRVFLTSTKLPISAPSSSTVPPAQVRERPDFAARADHTPGRITVQGWTCVPAPISTPWSM
jgi:hypothetical protein